MDHAGSGSASPTLVTTRLQLHGIAECLLAGPQYQTTGEIALAIIPGGFGTTAGSELRLDGLELVAGDTRGVSDRAVRRSCRQAWGRVWSARNLCGWKWRRAR